MTEIKRGLIESKILETASCVDSPINLHGMFGVGKSVLSGTIAKNEGLESPFESYKPHTKLINVCIHPIALFELVDTYPFIDISNFINDLTLYGGFPSTIIAPTYQDKRRNARRITNKIIANILERERFSDPESFTKLLSEIAQNIGKDFSISQVSKKLGINDRTTKRYLKILENYDMCFYISGYKRELKEEVDKFKRYYFTDCGVLNSISQNFTPCTNRILPEKLWENFLLSERRKYIDYSTLQNSSVKSTLHYWRTYTKLSINCVESQVKMIKSGDTSGNREKLFAYRFAPNNKVTTLFIPSVFKTTYKDATIKLITPNNCLDFITCQV